MSFCDDFLVNIEELEFHYYFPSFTHTLQPNWECSIRRHHHHHSITMDHHSKHRHKHPSKPVAKQNYWTIQPLFYWIQIPNFKVNLNWVCLCVRDLRFAICDNEFYFFLDPLIRFVQTRKKENNNNNNQTNKPAKKEKEQSQHLLRIKRICISSKQIFTTHTP